MFCELRENYMAKTQQVWERVMNGEIGRRNKDLPKFEGNLIISPKYATNVVYLKAWRNYCKTTPKENWPLWLVEDISVMTPKKK